MTTGSAPSANSDATGMATKPLAASATPPAAAPDRPAWRVYLPGAAGVAYLVAWVGGLAVWPVNLALNAPAERVTASYRGHPAQAVTQYVLVEGLAGVLLGIVLGCAVVAVLAVRGDSRVRGAAVQRRAAVQGRVAAVRGRVAGQGGVNPRTATAAALGAVAVATSLAQCVIGLFLTAAATGNHISASGTLSDLVNRLDGIKMLALACTAALLAAAGPALPRWIRAVAGPLGVSLIASGYAYLTLSNGLAWTAYIAGPLLLLWVTGTGIALTTRRRRGARTAT